MQKLYYGGNIITMRQKSDTPEALLEKDGVIQYVGNLEKAASLCEKDVQKIFLDGKTLMPAFIDPHSHLTMLAQFSALVPLGSCGSFEEIVDALCAYRDKEGVGDGNVLMGFGYDHNFLQEQAHPNRHVLDQVSAGMPVCILHASGHMCVANSALLEKMEIRRDTPDPAGGRYGREADGEPDGYLEEVPAMLKTLEFMFARTGTDFTRQVEAAQQVYLRNGITTVQEGALAARGFGKLAELAAAGQLSVDLVCYINASDEEEARAGYGEYWQGYHQRLRIGGIKLVLDGSPQGRSAWLSRPYEGEKTYCGYPSYPDEQVEKWVGQAVKDGVQVLAHCNGDAASEQYLRAYEKAAGERGEYVDRIRATRPVMIHCQTVRDDQLDRMATLGMIPSIFVAHTYYWGDIHLKNLGPVRGAHISPVKAALDRGLIYNFHQDTPVLEPDMLRTVWCAVNRRTRSGVAIGPDQCISVYEALKGVTINAAYAYHEEGKKGSLEPGKLADLVILDRNPLCTPKEDLHTIKVLETIKEGKTLYHS